MKDNVNSIDMDGKLDHEKMYNLFKTYSSKTNKKISEKINIFKYNIDFFKFYSNKDIKNLLYIFELEISENDESFSSFKSYIERYIYCIAQIILSVKLFLKTQDILTKIVINTKSNLSKLKYENKLENSNQDYLSLYLESLLKISGSNTKFHSSASTLFINNISSFEDIPKNSILRKFTNENKIDNLPKVEIEPVLYENQQTPRFELEKDEEFKNQEKKNYNLENSIENNFPSKKDSVLTLSKFVFAENPFTSHNLETKLLGKNTTKPKIKNNTTREKMPQSEHINSVKKNKRVFSENDFITKNKKKNHYRNLLEMINKMYKKGMIYSEEKLKLKQLVIEKSIKIDYFYYNIYKNSKNDNNILITEVKKIVN